MENQRYLVVIVPPQAEAALLSPGARPSILIPFNPEAIVSSFVVEIWKRLARHDGAIPLTAETHVVSLHLGGENGPAIDIEDRLVDIIADSQRQKIFAVFKNKKDIATVIQATTHVRNIFSTVAAPEPISFANALLVQVAPILTQPSDHDTDSLSFRIITPSTTKIRDSCPILTMPISATVRQLHLSIANTLGCTGQTQETVEGWECNCNLAKELALGYLDLTHFLVIRGKSIVEKFPLEVASVGSLQQALFSRFGQDIETRKRVTYHGATQDQDDSRTYTKIPVVAICSKQRHVPIHARVELDGSDRTRPQVLDLHTSELPIHPACFDSSVDMLGLSALAVNGVVDIFAVYRTSSAQLPLLKGRSAIFRDLAHWEPSIAQSDRGMAIFLSSLRVFASILQDMQSDGNAQDAAYYVFDELTQFPPALRCLHLLVSGQTPTSFECIALSQTILEVLRSYVAVDTITQDSARLFEGSRLLFGYILESAKSLRIDSDTEVHSDDEVAKKLRYTSVFCTYDVRDHKTHEAVLHALQTSDGLIEETLFKSLQDGGLLAETHLQSFLVQAETEPRLARFALQSGGTCPEVLVLSLGALNNIYGSQTGALSHACDLNQLRKLLQLAEMCSGNNLAVHGPSQLAAAISPCLTFDRNAHLAVYTGEEPCGRPGHSSIIFRPQHGEETIDPSVMERLIAPIVKSYEQDGSAVFDAYGGAQVRIIQDPDEIIMFCVDSSSSMGNLTDFSEVNEDDTGISSRPHRLIEQELHRASSLEESKEGLMAHNSFEDMIAIVAKTSGQSKDRMAREVLSLFACLLCLEINAKEDNLERARRSVSSRYVWHTAIHTLESELGELKAFGASLKANEEALAQFLMFRASFLDLEAVTRWNWSFGDPVPLVSRPRGLPVLPERITDVPSHLKCPISHALMEDAVEACDGQTYSRSAIERWFSIRQTSPLHGAPLDDLSLRVRPDIRSEVLSWISGPRETNTVDVIAVKFESRIGLFTRIVKLTATSSDLYVLAYRGLKAEFEAFELSAHNTGTLLPNRNVTVSNLGLKSLDRIMIRLPEDTAPLQTESYDSGRMFQDDTPEMCLMKVYEYLCEEQLFAFWVREDNPDLLLSVIWMYWRHKLDKGVCPTPEMRSVLTNVRPYGDTRRSWTYESPQQTARLSRFLTSCQCTGRLEPERLCSGDGDARISHSSHNVLKVMIGPEHGRKPIIRLTRLGVLKQMLDALINRMLAYNYKNHVGLVDFSSNAQVKMPISHVLENFRRATLELKAGGDTALWDALALAGDQIDQYATRFPSAKKRIVVISDGQDNKSSTNTCYGIVSSFLRKGISVDSVSIGDEDNTDLRTLSYMLGSYRFHPTSLTNTLAICEMEPFLSLSQRPPITLPLQWSGANIQTQFNLSRYRATATLVTDDIVPPIRDHPNMADKFCQLTSLAPDGNSAVSATTSSNPRRGLRVPRLMNEIRTIAARGGHRKYDIYISTADVSFWKIVVEGPEGSPYSDGAFLLYLHADEAYPRLAPKVRFVTKIKHPNVNLHGRICHSIFDRDWTSDTSMGTVLDTIYGLLYQPESSDPVNTTTTLGFFHDPVDFAEEARAHARKHASKTREGWKVEILGPMWWLE
ncbi:hypothetical protein KVR01_011359 [Diaporthe batatas]|uniref:uncharacterized protein n=1 Tax=Diaporthe batatas TaxID=748121 RepID=UPI001D03CEE1|nr:uncharacterized protein KVR01_011359 [Diaporthe batatas]KAG8158916.1 hypothetical protein KVR01_011359 [Diaporthe batatas]